MPSPAGDQLASGLRPHDGVALYQQQVEQHVSLVTGDAVPIPLGECEQALVPQHQQLVPDVLEPQKVEDESVDDFVGQRVLLVD